VFSRVCGRKYYLPPIADSKKETALQIQAGRFLFFSFQAIIFVCINKFR